MDLEQKKRAKRITKGTVTVLTIGAVYSIFTTLTGIGIPCLIKLITKKYCPGCGISRMLLSLIRGDIRSALSYNLLLSVIIIPGVFFGVRRAYLFIRYGNERGDTAENVFVFIVFILTIVFWIARNTETFSYLAPGGLLLFGGS